MMAAMNATVGFGLGDALGLLGLGYLGSRVAHKISVKSMFADCAGGYDVDMDEKDDYMSYCDQDVRVINKEQPDLVSSKLLFGRAGRACRLAGYTFDFLAGRKSKDSKLGDQDKRFVNAVSTALNGPKIYDDVTDASLVDFTDKGDKSKAFVTPCSLHTALAWHPLDGTITDKTIDDILSGKEPEPKNEPKLIEGPVEKSEATVDVLDKDGNVLASDVSSKKPEQKKPDNNQETKKDDKIIDLDVKPDEKVEPINFDPAKLDMTMASSVPEISEYVRKTFEKSFGEFLKDKSYQLNPLPGGAVECVVQNPDGIMNAYTIDPGISVGNGFNCYGRFQTGNPLIPIDVIPVNYRDKEICKNIFSDPNHFLTPEEVQKAASRMMPNRVIYNVVDFSRMGKNLREIYKDKGKMAQLNKTLTIITDSLGQNGMLARMRFKDWTDIEHFVLISDGKVTSPFVGQLTNVNGIEVTVNGSEAKIQISDSTSYTVNI